MKSIYGTRVTRLAATKRDRMITAVDLVVIEYGGIDCSVIRITAFHRGRLPIFNFGGSSIDFASAVLDLYIWTPGLPAPSSTVYAMPRMDEYAALFLYPSVTMKSQHRIGPTLTHISSYYLLYIP